jgi:hypothetical protein
MATSFVRIALVVAVCVATGARESRSAAPSTWALLIGIDRYPAGGQMRYAVADMNGLRDALIVSLRVPPDQIVLLADERATCDAIREGLRGLIAKAGAGDVVIVAFSGFGCAPGKVEHDERKSYLLPCDFSVKDRGRLLSLADDVYRPLSRRKDLGCRLVIVDASRDDCRARPEPLVTANGLEARALGAREAAALGVIAGGGQFELENTPGVSSRSEVAATASSRGRTATWAMACS